MQDVERKFLWGSDWWSMICLLLRQLLRLRLQGCFDIFLGFFLTSNPRQSQEMSSLKPVLGTPGSSLQTAKHGEPHLPRSCRYMSQLLNHVQKKLLGTQYHLLESPSLQQWLREPSSDLGPWFRFPCLRPRLPPQHQVGIGLPTTGDILRHCASPSIHQDPTGFHQPDDLSWSFRRWGSSQGSPGRSSEPFCPVGLSCKWFLCHDILQVLLHGHVWRSPTWTSFPWCQCWRTSYSTWGSRPHGRLALRPGLQSCHGGWRSSGLKSASRNVLSTAPLSLCCTTPWGRSPTRSNFLLFGREVRDKPPPLEVLDLLAVAWTRGRSFLMHLVDLAKTPVRRLRSTETILGHLRWTAGSFLLQLLIGWWARKVVRVSGNPGLTGVGQDPHILSTPPLSLHEGGLVPLPYPCRRHGIAAATALCGGVEGAG